MQFYGIQPSSSISDVHPLFIPPLQLLGCLMIASSNRGVLAASAMPCDCGSVPTQRRQKQLAWADTEAGDDANHAANADVAHEWHVNLQGQREGVQWDHVSLGTGAFSPLVTKLRVKHGVPQGRASVRWTFQSKR